jgi:hypothetical protein
VSEWHPLIFLHSLITDSLNSVDQNTEITEAENQLVKGLVAFVVGVCLQSWELAEGKADKKYCKITTFLCVKYSITKYLLPSPRSNLMQLLERRQVGRERLAEHLEGVSKSEFYIRAAQRPQPLAKSPSDLLLDYQFTKFFKALESGFFGI